MKIFIMAFADPEKIFDNIKWKNMLNVLVRVVVVGIWIE